MEEANERSLSPSEDAGSLASLLGAVARTGHAALAEGTIVAEQYRIVRPIGEGGMGVVYLARDTTLHREVAVKLCTGLSVAAVHRIQREAMALAKLTHPNVVVVYQAGEVDDRFFIAMEYVAGGTAAAWVRERSVAEIVALYAAAGDGLEAAHRAGFVHRDFKPDNVLVDSDGRPRVADFGLARASEEAETVEDGVPVVGDRQRTQAGAVMGTLAYMAPEQLAGEDVDARADQYAFAVSLWEALFGARPPADPIRDRSTVPKHIVAALQRALAEAREQRWPDMSALLVELRRDPAAKRRRAIAFAGAIAMVGVGAATASVWGREEPEPLCTDAPDQIGEVWNGDRSAAIALVVGDNAWPAIEGRLSTRVDAWIEQHRAACRATRVDGSASEDVLDRRMLCLDERKQELEATLRVLEHGTATAVGNAAAAIDMLPASEQCISVVPFAGQDLPSDPAIREQIRQAQAVVAEASASSLDPTALDALEKAERAVELARASQWKPIIAKALTTRAVVLQTLHRYTESVAAFTEAQHATLVARTDDTALLAYADGAEALANIGRLAEADHWLAIAHALWERSGHDPELGNRLYGNMATVAWHAERNEDGLAAVLQQVELAEQAFGTAATQQATNQFNLAGAYHNLGRLSESREAIERAVELATSALGEDHPTPASYIAHESQVLFRMGELAKAQELALRSLAISERWFGPDDLRHIMALDVLSAALRQRGELAVAEAIDERVLALRRRGDPASPEIAKDEHDLAVIAIQQGKLEAAAPRAAAALAALEASYGPESPLLIDALNTAAYIARERSQPDLDASLQHLERARTIAAATIGSDSAAAVNLDNELSYTLVARGDSARAVELLEPRLAELGQLELPVQITAELKLALAKALKDEARACSLAEQAEADLRGADMAPLLAAATQWRAQHCAAKP